MATMNPNASIGAMQIGSTIMTFLFGISTLQSYNYMYYYPRDPLWLKSLVFVVWLAGTGHTISVTAAMYSLTITHFGDLSSVDIVQMPRSFVGCIALSGFMSWLVQGYFAHRLRVFSKKLYIPVFCWSMSALILVGRVSVAVKVLQVPTWQEFLQAFDWLLASVYLGGACLDIIIAASMCYYLKRERTFAITRTAKMLDKLMIYSIESCLLTSMTALAIFVCYKSMPTNDLFFAVSLFFPEVFANSMLVSLNLRRVHNDDDETVICLSQTSAQDRTSSSRLKSFPKRSSTGAASDYLGNAKSTSVGYDLDPLPGDIVIEITQETQEHRDGSMDSEAFVPKL